MRFWIIVVSSLLYGYAHGEPLGVGPLSGTAPLEVAISGPQLVLDKMAKCQFGLEGWFGSGGNGLSVDWGDGSDIFSGKTDGSCAEAQRKHVYRLPGTYRLLVTAWHPGPTDRAVIDWSGGAWITVAGEGAADSLELIEPEESKSHYYQETILVRWKASAQRASKIWIEFFGEDGVSFGTPEEFRWATSGEKTVYTFPYSSPVYDAALRRGLKAFFVRVSLIRDGRSLIARDSPPQGMSAELRDTVQHLTLKEVGGSGPFEASLRLRLLFGDQSSYRIDWGDGQITESIRPLPEGYMGGNYPAVTLSHTYATSGQYKILLHTNDGEFKPLDDILYYYALSVDVTPRSR